MKNNRILYLMIIGMLFGSCSKLTKLTDSITKPSAREIYGREFKKDNIAYTNWQTYFENALSDSIQIELPYVEKGSFIRNANFAYSYLINLKEGEVLTAEVLRDSIAHRVFIDIFDVTAANNKPLESRKPDDYNFEFAVEQSRTYRLVLQPEINANTNFYILIGKKPAFRFPVSGKGNAAIQSLWGYERDGGLRSHEGVDIFAPRGTPVVAVTDGIVANTGERGLGGKQVWLRTREFRASLYYAHLDSIAVSDGMQVGPGDTLGFVGSTGNAKGGPAHLHFGIYKNGAVDPLPFIFVTEKIKRPSLQTFTKSLKTTKLKIKGTSANLRQMPSTGAAIIGKLAASDVVKLLGEHDEWLHIQTAAGKKAFLHRSLAREEK